MPNKKKACVSPQCVACGCCIKVCPKGAITIIHGCYAQVEAQQCIGCGLCVKACPANVISLIESSNL